MRLLRAEHRGRAGQPRGCKRGERQPRRRAGHGPVRRPPGRHVTSWSRPSRASAMGARVPARAIGAVLRAEDERAQRERRVLSSEVRRSRRPSGLLLLMLSFLWSPFGERATMWVMLALATPVQFWAGWEFYAGAWRVAPARLGRHEHADRRRDQCRLPLQRPGDGRPGIFESGGELPDVYFDTAAVIIALILLGRLLEARARGRHHRGDQEADRPAAADRDDRP